ncbi:hypothetical protein THAOC_28856, partial [Thalassiosira oceanica]
DGERKKIWDGFDVRAVAPHPSPEEGLDEGECPNDRQPGGGRVPERNAAGGGKHKEQVDSPAPLGRLGRLGEEGESPKRRGRLRTTLPSALLSSYSVRSRSTRTSDVGKRLRLWPRWISDARAICRGRGAGAQKPEFGFGRGGDKRRSVSRASRRPSSKAARVAVEATEERRRWLTGRGLLCRLHHMQCDPDAIKLRRSDDEKSDPCDGLDSHWSFLAILESNQQGVLCWSWEEMRPEGEIEGYDETAALWLTEEFQVERRYSIIIVNL